MDYCVSKVSKNVIEKASGPCKSGRKIDIADMINQVKEIGELMEYNLKRKYGPGF